MKRTWEFWVIVGFMVTIIGFMLTIMGFMLSMNARMATKDDLNRVETSLKADIIALKTEIDRVETALKAEIKEVRDLTVRHIMASHQGHSHGKPVAKNLEAGKYQKKSPPQGSHTQSSRVAKKAQ